VLRHLPSPGLLALLAALALGAGVAVSQEEKKSDKLPPPRVVGDSPKAKADTPTTKPKDIPVGAKEEPKKDQPKKALTFDPVPDKAADKKEEAKKEEAKADAKEEPKKEEAKVDPLAEVKTAAEKAGNDAKDGIKRGDNAWVLAASALVLLMTPGLALFYGGMVRKKNVLATMMQSYAAMAVVGLYWVAVGYGLAFGPSQIKISALGVEDGGIIGWDWKLFFLQGVNPQDTLAGYNIPVFTHVMFQGMFAIITPALISGAIAERIRFWPWTIFMILWVTFVYCPLAHMVWAFDWFSMDPATAGKDVGASAIGFLGKLGALDFAGGTVVHIAAGFGGLACICVLRKRTGYPEHAMHPNSMVLTLIGAGLLWFGWFGFNGGSALGAGDLGSSGFTTTQAAAAAAGLTWCLVEWIFKGKPTALGLASGIVAGLVAVTPASGFVLPWGGAAIGVAAGVVCYFAVQVKALLGYDDSLDAFGVHGIGGFLGAVLTGVFCYAIVQPASADGMVAHMRLEHEKAGLQREADTLKAEIPAIEKTGPELQKKSEDAAKKVEAAKDDKEKDKLQADADKAKAEFDEVAKKVDRRKARIDAIEKKKDSAKPDDKGGEIAQLEDKIAGYKKDEKGPMTQPVIQLKAATISAVFAFVVSLALAALVQVITLGNFRTAVPDENEGLDQTEHGETGFDLGGPDSYPTVGSREPKAAKVPPGGKRFEVVVEGIENGGLLTAWSQLCQPKEDGPIDPDFKAVYPYVTTVQGNRFRLRGGDPKALSGHIQKLFTRKLGKPVKTRVEE
jgi:ammonium transporter, Amt family